MSPTSDRPLSDLADDEFSERVDSLGQAARASIARFALVLEEVGRNGYHLTKGFSDLNGFSQEFGDYPADHYREWSDAWHALAQAPRLQDLMLQGVALLPSYQAVAHLVRPETADWWADQFETLSAMDLDSLLDEHLERADPTDAPLRRVVE